MSLRLERGFGGLAGAALAAALAATLAAAMLALSPAAAGAQTRDESAPSESTPSVVVRPGDSLWSISEERLGPDASPRRVMRGAERIHALNRERIGADPALVLAGQELTIPRAMSEPPNGATPPARKAAEASGPDPRERAAKGPAGKGAPRKASGQGAIPRSAISLEEAAGMLGAGTAGKEALPNQRAVAPVPAARTVASNDAQPSSVGPLLSTVRTGFASAASALTDPLFGAPADARAEGRRLLGLVVLALTPAVAALAAACARGAARRKARRREAWFREGYGSPYAALDPSASQEGASRRVPGARGQTASSGSPANAGAAPENRTDRVGLAGIVRQRQRAVRGGRAAQRPPGRRPAAGAAYAPGLRRAVQTARRRGERRS